MDSAGLTAQSTVDFPSGLIKQSPQPRSEMVRVLAEDDMLFLHVCFTSAKAPKPATIGEIFRIRNGKLAGTSSNMRPNIP